MTILILSGVRGDTQRYRSFHPYEQLRLAGAPCELSHVTDPALPSRFERARLAILHRVAFDPYIERLVDGIQERGGLVIGDVDDLVFDPAAFHWIDSPDFQDPQRTVLYQEEMGRYRRTLESCQGITASTNFLAEQARRLGISAWIHRNGFSLELLALSETAYGARTDHSPAVILGYASGTPTHDRDFEIAKPAIIQALARYPQAELCLIGPLNPGEGWGETANRVRRLKRVPWRRLPEIQAGFDVNLAPLVTDNPFSRSKSEIKYMEAALVRVPTVASPTEAFAHAIRPGENGFLASDEGEWLEALSNLIEGPGLRRAVGQRAYEDVLARYHPAVRAAGLIDTINQIHTSARQTPLWDQAAVARMDDNLVRNSRSPQEAWMDREVLKPPSLARMALYSLRHRGARTMLLQVRVYLRRMAAPLVPYASDRRKTG